MAAVGALALLTTACGDDDDADASGGDVAAETSASEVAAGASGGDVEAYCAAVAAIDGEGEITVEQMEAIRDAAPEEISDDVEFVANAFIEAIEAGEPDAAFADEEVGRRLEEVIEPFEAENCPDDDDAGEAAVEIAPEHEAYCAASAAFNEQESEPSNEQLQELIDLAPEEIAADVELAAGAFIERGEEAFTDDAVNEAIDRIDAFDEEACGIGLGGPAELESSDEVDPDAQRVDVTAVEYEFQLTPPTAAGPTSFVMTNDGEEAHFMYIARLAEGVTLEEAGEAEGEGGTLDAEVESGVAAPGEEVALTVDLDPGNYVMLCFITAPDGESHDEKGMTVPFTVS